MKYNLSKFPSAEEYLYQISCGQNTFYAAKSARKILIKNKSPSSIEIARLWRNLDQNETNSIPFPKKFELDYCNNITKY